MGETPGPLDGLTVIELGGSVSAAYASRCLGDLGARVIKVEPPDGDPARRHGPFPEGAPHPERSGLFCLLNTNKLGITLSLNSSADRSALGALLEHADALVENLHPDELGAADLSPALTAERYPRLVHCSITAFGHHGPWRRFHGYALQAAAAGGASVVIGEPGRAPLPLPCSQPDFQAGINAAAGVLLALLARRRTGQGQHVDVASTDVMAFYGGITSPLYTATGLQWTRAGHRASGSGGFYPYTILPTRDGYLCMITRSGQPWRRFLDALGSPPWTREPRYRDRAALGRRYPEEGDRLLAPDLEKRSSADLQDLCRGLAIPFAMVRSTAEVVACPQLAARGFWVSVERAEVGRLRYPGAPWRFSATPWRITRPAPLLGEHNDVVLGQPSGSCRSGQPQGLARSTQPPVGPLGSLALERPAHHATRSAAPGAQRPLDGIRVVDFGWVAVGPVLSSLLAEFGAEVIKIESSRRLDYCRLIPTPMGEHEQAAEAFAQRAAEVDTVPLFHQYNRGKLGVTVDLRHPEGPALLKRLVARCDVVVENFSPSVLRSVGLDYEALSRVRPDLVMISCSATGHGGPWEALRTFAPSLTSLAGLERLIGYEGERALGALTLGYGDPSNAHHGFFAVLAALWHRARTGQGQWIDMSQLEATVGLIGEALMDLEMNGRVWDTQGAFHASMVPHGHYPAAGEDAWVAISCADDREWAGLRRAMGDPVWARDASLSSLSGRLAAHGEIDTRLARWTRGLSAEEVTLRCQTEGVAAVPMLGLEAHGTHPHFHARGALTTVRHPRAGQFSLYASPIKLSATPGRIERTAPCLGEDNERVFQEILGLNPREYREVQAQAVVR